MPDNPDYLKGVLSGLVAVSIWASWSVVTRLIVTTDLNAWDIPMLRFGIAGLLLSPIVVRRGLALNRLGWLGLAVIIAGNGAPYAFVAASGLQFAPAYDQGALNPGCMPLFVALVATVVLKESLSPKRKAGLSLILAGAVLIIAWHGWGRAWSISRTFGDALFLLASFLTACFTVTMRQTRLEPLHAAALVATGSLVTYLPIYLLVYRARLAQLTLTEFTTQAFFQGVLVTIVSLVLYARAVAILGASEGASFGALVPALSAVFAIPLLGEWPSEADGIAIVLISSGVYFASGHVEQRRRSRECCQADHEAA